MSSGTTNEKRPPLQRDSYRRPRRQLYTVKAKEIPEMAAGDIVELRRTLQLTQPEFARIFGVTRDTLKDWERGGARPNSAAQRLMYLISHDHSIIYQLVTVTKNKDDKTTLFPE